MIIEVKPEIHWKAVVGYEGYYEISSTGILRSIDRNIKDSKNRIRIQRGITIKPKPHPDGYLFATVSKHGIPKTVYFHRMVLEAHGLNPENKQEVNHKNGIKSDNRIENLEWVTHQENMGHCYDTGLCGNVGGDHYFAVGVIDNLLGKVFRTIGEWCIARGIKYSTGRNLLSGHNRSKTIDLTGVFKIKKDRNG